MWAGNVAQLVEPSLSTVHEARDLLSSIRDSATKSNGCEQNTCTVKWIPS